MYVARRTLHSDYITSVLATPYTRESPISVKQHHDSGLRTAIWERTE
jgi:hypothetical protein